MKFFIALVFLHSFYFCTVVASIRSTALISLKRTSASHVRKFTTNTLDALCDYCPTVINLINAGNLDQARAVARSTNLLGETPLMRALQQYDLETIQRIAEISDVYQHGDNGDTILHKAAEFKDTTYAELFAQDLDLLKSENYSGKTPLDVALEKENYATAAILKKAGSPKMNNETRAILEERAKIYRKEIARLLKTHSMSDEAIVKTLSIIDKLDDILRLSYLPNNTLSNDMTENS